MLKNQRWLLAVCYVFFLLGCSQQEATQYEIVSSGASDNWTLQQYKIQLGMDHFKAGGGTLARNDASLVFPDTFQFDTHLVIDGKDTVVHSLSYTGGAGPIENKVGTIESGAYLQSDGAPITMDDVEEAYMIIEWTDSEQKEPSQERIDLYSR